MPSVLLTWRRGGYEEDEVRVYRDTSPITAENPGQLIATLAPDIERYIDHEVVNGQTYYYVIESVKGEATKTSVAIEVTPDDSLTPPGNDYLIANNGVSGLFGLVEQADFITAQDLLDRVGVKVGNPINHDTMRWLKFGSNGKVVYIAEQPIMASIPFFHLDTRNVVDGSLVLDIGGLPYSLRLPRGEDSEEHGVNDFTGLLHYCTSSAITGIATNEKWIQLTTMEAGGTYTYCQELDTGGKVLARRPNTIATTTYLTTATSGAYRPVLELLVKEE